MRNLYLTMPLVALLYLVLPAQPVNTLILQPDFDCAKEKIIWRLITQNGPFGTTNSNSYNGITFLPIMNWTWNGSPGQRWLLLDFLHQLDLPTDLEVLEARLSLFAPTAATSDGFHSLETNTGKPSIAVIQRITSSWDDATANWNNQPTTTTVNEVILPPPTTETQDYPDIDITALIQDQVNNPAAGFGLLIRMQETDYYRKLVFAGSAAENPALRPRLELTYRGEVIDPAGVSYTLLPETLELCPGEPQTIEPLNPERITAYLWSTGSTSSSLTVETPGVYSLLATLDNCLQVRDTILVVEGDCEERPNCEVIFPDLFSPNQDGENDVFRPFYAEDCPLQDFRLEIYNRWGQKVYESDIPTAAWNGTLNGKNASPDVYIYQARYRLPGTQETISKSGQLTLLR